MMTYHDTFIMTHNDGKRASNHKKVIKIMALFKSLSEHWQTQSKLSLPLSQIRRIGLLYYAYRLFISVILFVTSYALVYDASRIMVRLPSLLQQLILMFYILFSLFAMTLFVLVKHKSQRQLLVAFVVDVIFFNFLIFINGAADIQMMLLIMVVVAASFMLLISYQAVVITMLAVILIIYQQFFYAIAGSMTLLRFSDAMLMALSFISVGFLSWTLSKRLAQVEQIASQHAETLATLNRINTEVISKINHGVLVLDTKNNILLHNHAVTSLLHVTDLHVTTKNNAFFSDTQHKPAISSVRLGKTRLDKKMSARFKRLIGSQSQEFEQEQQQLKAVNQNNLKLNEFIKEQLPRLQDKLDAARLMQQSQFELQPFKHIDQPLRFNTTLLQDNSLLVIIEDVKRERNNAQQLKLASLGQLTASIAHEIRNPLAAISQASQLLIADADEWQLTANTITASAISPSNDANAELYQMIFKQTKRVNRIIEDVLRLSRQDKPNLQALNLIEWLTDFIANHFQGHDVFLQGQCDCQIFFDPHQLEQILINLINNGLKFSSKVHAHAFVILKVGCDVHVTIDVIDEGVGVTQAQQEQLFMPFFTTDNQGTGLGLYLSQSFAHANHAQLSYEAEHEHTCFRLMIPKAVQPPTGHMTQSSPLK